MLRKTKLYIIEWSINGVVKETLNFNKPTPIGVANWWIKHLKATTHKTGVLTPKMVIK